VVATTLFRNSFTDTDHDHRIRSRAIQTRCTTSARACLESGMRGWGVGWSRVHSDETRGAEEGVYRSKGSYPVGTAGTHNLLLEGLVTCWGGSQPVRDGRRAWRSWSASARRSRPGPPTMFSSRKSLIFKTRSPPTPETPTLPYPSLLYPTLNPEPET